VRPVRGLWLLAGFAGLLVAGWMLGALVEQGVGQDAARIDLPVTRWFVDLREPWLTSAAKLATTLGNAAVVIPIALVVGVLVWFVERAPRSLTFLSVTFAGAQLLSHLVKRWEGRPRPPRGLAVRHYAGFAFPSGHATLSAAMWIAIAIALLVVVRTRPWQTLIVAVGAAIAIVIGVTRIYLGAHWLTDVAGGWLLGGAWTYLTARTFAMPGSADYVADPCASPSPRTTPVSGSRAPSAST
jgi:membrane-associated phospholipid phosphatase